MKDRSIWIEWFERQSPEDQRAIAVNAIDALIDSGLVRFWGESEDDREAGELYWESCGESLNDH